MWLHKKQFIFQLEAFELFVKTRVENCFAKSMLIFFFTNFFKSQILFLAFHLTAFRQSEARWLDFLRKSFKYKHRIQQDLVSICKNPIFLTIRPGDGFGHFTNQNLFCSVFVKARPLCKAYCF